MTLTNIEGAKAMAIDDNGLPLDPTLTHVYQFVLADARRRIAAGTLNNETEKVWSDQYLPKIENAIAEIRKTYFVQ
jgi:hypothetical protein